MNTPSTLPCPRWAFRWSQALLAFALVFTTLAPSPAAAQDTVRRLALVVGANDGGDDRVRLRYAEDDAVKFATVLRELGGVAPDDSVVLLDATADSLRAGLDAMGTRLQPALGAGRVEVVLYYSGHSDEQGLLLAGERVGYKELRSRFDALRADVRIIVLDSCAAGALARSKGGVRRPPFLVDASSDVSGHAFLTSSSADEVAQESDVIGGSFFTHYLVTGLRGAADVSEDSKVTLNEAYQFAFHETLARTESTSGGAQHAVYEIQLTGTGDLVLTDLRAAESSLVFTPDLMGRIFVRDEQGALVAELGKNDARAVELDVKPGSYQVRVDQVSADGDKTLLEGTIEVPPGRDVAVAPATLRPAPKELAVARGPVILDPDTGRPAVESEDPFKDVPFEDPDPSDDLPFAPVHIGFVPGIGINDGFYGGKAHNTVSINVIFGGPERLTGVGVAGGVTWTNRASQGVLAAGAGTVTNEGMRGVQAAGGGNVSRGEMVGLLAAGAANLALGELYGVQAAGAFNWAESMHGVQLTGAASVAREIHGLQISGATSIADEADGAQLSMVNVGGHVDGAQIGVVNVADKVEGVQFGLINIATESDYPIGLLSFVGNGIFAPSVWVSETAYANAGLRMGGRNVYTLLFAGTQTFGSAQRDWIAEVGFGIGGRVYVSDALHVDLDVQHSQFLTHRTYHPETLLERARIGLGWQVFEHLAVYGGASFNTLVELSRDALTIREGPLSPYVVHPRTETDDVEVSVFPGFFAGVEF